MQYMPENKFGHIEHAILKVELIWTWLCSCFCAKCMFFLDGLDTSFTYYVKDHTMYADTSRPHVVSSSAFFFVLDFEQFFLRLIHIVDGCICYFSSIFSLKTSLVFCVPYLSVFIACKIHSAIILWFNVNVLLQIEFFHCRWMKWKSTK